MQTLHCSPVIGGILRRLSFLRRLRKLSLIAQSLNCDEDGVVYYYESLCIILTNHYVLRDVSLYLDE